MDIASASDGPGFVGIKFCQECNNMLYPKEDKQNKRLLYSGYKDAQKRVTTKAVVNDAADGGVKLAQDLLESSKNEESYQNVFQIKELHRKKQPNQKHKISQ